MIYYKKKIQQDIGATAIEYGLIASLVAVVAFSGMSAVGVNLSNTYCTISKHLGGSGTCSGSGSSGTGGNGSGSTSTGSINNTNSIADDSILEQITKGLTDELDTRLVPKSLGGKDSDPDPDSGVIWSYKDEFDGVYGDPSITGLRTNLSNINAKDPITNVFGVYDMSNNYKPITDYEQVNDALQKGGGNIAMGHNYSLSIMRGNVMEFTTASGKVYTVSDVDGSVNENPIPK